MSQWDTLWACRSAIFKRCFTHLHFYSSQFWFPDFYFLTEYFYIAILLLLLKYCLYPALPSSTSTGTSCTNCSHQRRDDCLAVHSWMSNLQRRPARYMTATAMISGSHCSDSMVHRLHGTEHYYSWLWTLNKTIKNYNLPVLIIIVIIVFCSS